MTVEEHFTWLVPNRNKAQELLHRVYRVIPDKGEWGDHAVLLHLLTGVAFSLWRAVFLAERDRDATEVARKAKMMLKRVIETNAISFNDDLLNKSWTAGYYLNNALWRLESAYQFLGISSPLREQVKKILDLSSKTGHGPAAMGAKEIWDTAFSATDEVLGALDTVKSTKRSKSATK